jgi:hypothetical protein
LVKSELYQLEKLIAEIVSGEQKTNNGNPPAKFAGQVKSVVAVCTSLKGKWIHELFSSIKEHILTRYVQYHQAGITALSNLVSTRIPASYFQGPENQLYQLYYTVVRSLEELLEFLRQGFYKYFDSDYAVSTDHYRAHAEQISLRLEEVKPLLHKTGIDAALVESIVVSFNNRVTDAKQSGISYRQLNYCHNLLNIISQKVKEQPELATIELANELFRQNFNSYYFNQWYQNYLGTIISAAVENKREVTILAQVKLLGLQFVERHKLFEPELPPINEQLLLWLSQMLPAQSIAPIKDIFKVNGHTRMPLQFSVTQFALFVRLCYLEGCFHVNNISDILRFFTQHFETKKQLNISFKSFARAFYGADQATAAVVRDFLQRIINTLNKTYFP